MTGNIIQDPDYLAPAYTIVDLGFGIRDRKDRFKLSFLVNNALDKQYVINGFGQTPSYRGSAAQPASVTIPAWRPGPDTFPSFTARPDITPQRTLTLRPVTPPPTP